MELHLIIKVMEMSEDIPSLLVEARTKCVDPYQLAAAKTFGKDHQQVSAVERDLVRTAFFMFGVVIPDEVN